MNKYLITQDQAEQILRCLSGARNTIDVATASDALFEKPLLEIVTAKSVMLSVVSSPLPHGMIGV